jgi:hypothetical protein
MKFIKELLKEYPIVWKIVVLVLVLDSIAIVLTFIDLLA